MFWHVRLTHVERAIDALGEDSSCLSLSTAKYRGDGYALGHVVSRYVTDAMPAREGVVVVDSSDS